jgi:hypothetical protein
MRLASSVQGRRESLSGPSPLCIQLQVIIIIIIIIIISRTQLEYYVLFISKMKLAGKPTCSQYTTHGPLTKEKNFHTPSKYTGFASQFMLRSVSCSWRCDMWLNDPCVTKRRAELFLIQVVGSDFNPRGLTDAFSCFQPILVYPGMAHYDKL